MPKIFCCPFYSWEEDHRIHCEGGVMDFLDTEAKDDYTDQYCANCPGWQKCTVAKSRRKTYERVFDDE